MPNRATPAAKVAPGSSVDSAYQRLRESIVDGEYAPGSQLRHSDLSDQLGLSLIPIREALRRLEAERLVESTPNKGARVMPISADDLRDVYSTRVLLEQEALRRAWPNLGEEIVEQLRSINTELVDSVERHRPAVYDLHRQLHFSIYEAANSSWLLHVIEMVWAHTERYRRLAARARPFVDVGDDLHSHLIDAIEERDLVSAKRWMRRDLLRTADVLLSTYDDTSLVR